MLQLKWRFYGVSCFLRNDYEQHSYPCRGLLAAGCRSGYSLLFQNSLRRDVWPDSIDDSTSDRDRAGLPSLNGVVMELDDGAFPLLKGVVATANLDEGFRESTGPCSSEVFRGRPAWSGRIFSESMASIFVGQAQAIEKSCRPRYPHSCGGESV